MNLAAGALDLRQAVHGIAELRAQQIDVDARLGQQPTHAAALLVEQCHHDVRRLDELVIRPTASDCASASAIWNLLVSLSIRIRTSLSRYES